MTAAGIDALSDGRCVLGLGASGPQVIEGFHGVTYDKPLGRTREIIDICRQVWRRERVEHDGASYQIPLPEGQGTGLGKPLKLINHPVRSEIPIYVASLGPKNVEMTAEKADGWLPLFYLPEKAKDVWGDDLAAGAAKRDAGLGPMEVVAGGLLSVGDGAEGVREFGRPMTALYVGGMGAKGRNFYNDLVKRYGYEQEAEQIQDLYLDGKKDEAARARARRAPRGHHPLRVRGLREGAPRRLQGERRHRPQRHARRPRPGEAHRAGQDLDRGPAADACSGPRFARSALRKCLSATGKAARLRLASATSMMRWRSTRVSHRSNLRPTSGMRATTVNPRVSWKRIEGSLSASTAATSTWRSIARARSTRASMSALPMPWLWRSPRTWTVSSAVWR